MTYSVGLIGLSWIGAWHRDAYDDVEGIDVVAIADVEEEALAERGEEWEIPEACRYRDHTELLAAEDLDVVSVATPSFLHHDHVIDAANSNADPDVVWAEKPIATSVSDADDMVEVCAEADVELVVNHIRRFGTPYRTLETLITEDKVIGDVQAINVTAPEELLRNGTHSIDLIDFLLDEQFQWGFGYLTEHSDHMSGEFDDSGGAGMIVTDDGTYVHVDCTVPRGVHDGTWNIVGNEGKLYVDPERDECRYWALEEREDEPYGTTHVETGLPRTVESFSDTRAMFTNGAEHVVELLEGTTENRSPGEDAAHVLEIIVALFVAHYTNAAIELPLERPLRDVHIQSR